MSRTDLDFEQALRQEGTVVLREGIDVNSLGVESPSPALNRSYSSSATPVNRTISRVALQPSTPVVVPPTPSPVTSPFAASSSRLAPSHGPVGPSPSSSSHDLVTDAEEAERQTNRRSMYRSPGTASSPDLATLLRKAKERGGAFVGGHVQSRARREEPPPLPPDPSYSSATLVASTSSKNEDASTADWVLPSPHRAKDSGTVKVSCLCFFLLAMTERTNQAKSTVRAKTSAFWGKMIGQSTVRERSVRCCLMIIKGLVV